MTKNINCSWLRCPVPQPNAKLKLFCFPYGGSGAGAFRNWPKAFSEDVEVHLVVPPGREHRFGEKPFENVLPMVREMINEILPYLGEKFAFFGHSVGALIAFELCRELRRSGERLPRALIVSGRSAPQVPHNRPHLHNLEGRELANALQAIGGTPQSLINNAEMLAAISPLLRADFKVTESYQYYVEEPFEIPIVAFHGRNDPTVMSEEVMAWQEQACTQFKEQEFDGDHFFIDGVFDAVIAEINKHLSVTM